MILATYTFDGDPDVLLETHHEMMSLFPPNSLDLHLAVTTDAGLTVFDSCPDLATHEAFVVEPRVPRHPRSCRPPAPAHRRARRGPLRHDEPVGPPMTELARLDGIAQADLVARGEVTRAELVEAAIERVEDLNPTLNAVVTPMFERALSHAGAATGPLAGVPMLLKDLVAEVEGVRFTEGSRFLADNVSTYTSEIVRRFEAAGLVIIGKSATPEFGMSPSCEGALFGPTRNPWDLTRSTSGSSGGSAAAVAAGIVPIAHANDLGGSIRYPASNCGLFGLKPTRARNPLGPEYGDAVSGWAVEHVVTRTVRDSAAVLDATSGPMLGDPVVAPAPVPAVPSRGRRRSGPAAHRLHLADRRRRARAPRLRGRPGEDRRAAGRARPRRGRSEPAGADGRGGRGHRCRVQRGHVVDRRLLGPAARS